MPAQFIKTVTKAVSHWYIPLLIGILFLIAGIYTLTSPAASFLALAIFFSWTFLISGLSEIIFAVANRNTLDHWGWHLAFGIVDFAIGFLLIVNPVISMNVLAIYVGFVVMFRSIAAISTSIELRSYGVADWAWMLFIGVLGIILSFILISNPALGGMTVVFWTGLLLITAGLTGIILGFKLRKLHKKGAALSDELKSRYEKIRQEMQAELSKR
ncbi:HdeD family acid-resistance protein [Pollutibacter soli]|uniref:HdeD family acid-resistance protein n=1 Tax=Pollutibacter soli TaxID=3034157 RepID=UPI003013B9CB